MKIVYVSLWQKDNGGGAGRISYEMADSVAAQGEEVALISPSRKTEIKEENGVKHIYVESTIVKDVAYPKLNTKTTNFIIKFLDEFNPDIVHSHCEGFLSMVAEVWALKNKKKFVMSCHFLPSKLNSWQLVDKSSDILVKIINKFGFTEAIMKDSFNNCNAVIALNKVAADDIKEFGYKGEIWQISNGCNLSMFNKIETANPDDEIINLYFTGYITQRKNQLYLVEVLKYLSPKYHLLLVGNTDDKEYLLKVNKRIQKYNLTNRVEIIDIVPEKEIPSIISKCHLCISAATHEVQSLAIIEALASGRPVVGLSNPTIDEFVDDQVGKKLPTDTSPKDFAQYCENIINNKNIYNLQSVHSRIRVSKINWENISKEIVEHYDNILGYDGKDKFRFKTKLLTGLSLLVGGIVYSFMKSKITKKPK